MLVMVEIAMIESLHFDLVLVLAAFIYPWYMKQSVVYSSNVKIEY